MKSATWSLAFTCLQRSCPPLMLLVLLCVSSAAGAKTEGEEPVSFMKCWECMNYDSAGNFYNQCPMHANVDTVRAYLGNCTGKCFTHTDDLNKKLIVRGCTASQWGLPDPLPQDGCYPWYSEIWCVCSSNGCNGVRLGNLTTDKEFDAHIDYSKTNGSGGCRVDYSIYAFALTVTVSCMLAIAFNP